MILLAIDTATESCSAALWVDGKIYQQQTIQPRLHAELILPFIDDVLAQACLKKSQIQGLLVGQGPGAFTGVRIAIGVAQALGLALNIPVVPVSNLQTLAFVAYQHLQTDKPQTILVATDARMQEVYWGKFLIVGKHIEVVTEEQVSTAGKVDSRNIDAYIGNGFSVYPELMQLCQHQPMPFVTLVYSQAQDMLKMLADDFGSYGVAADVLQPVYLRQP